MNEEKIHYAKVPNTINDNNFKYEQEVETTAYTLSLIMEKLEQQLKAHKRKEDKSRKIFEDENLPEFEKYYYGDSYELEVHELRKDILKILNDGGDD